MFYYLLSFVLRQDGYELTIKSITQFTSTSNLILMCKSLLSVEEKVVNNEEKLSNKLEEQCI
jgi:hypothetical protein